MSPPQHLLVQPKDRLHLSEHGGAGIVVNRNEPALLVVAIAQLVGIARLESVGQIPDAVVANAPHDSSTVDHLVTDVFHQVRQRPEGRRIFCGEEALVQNHC